MQLEAGKAHHLKPTWTIDGQPDPEAQVLGVMWLQPRESDLPVLDLTEAEPGQTLTVVVTCQVMFSTGAVVNVGLSGMVEVVAPAEAPAPVEEPAPPTPVYGGELGFSD